MFLARSHLSYSLNASSRVLHLGRFTARTVDAIRLEHTVAENQNKDSEIKVSCDQLSEIYKGKKRKLEYNENLHSLKAVSNSVFTKENFSWNELRNTTRIRLTEIFLPRNYPTSVKGKYLNYCTFAALGMGLSAAGGVLSTQSMLFAVGMGAGAVPMAAALNWVLKDGLGQLGGMAFTALVNSRLDADSRGWRILTAWVLEISTWLEVMTPLLPSHFLLLATMANVGKNISWLAGSATRAGIRYGFVNAHNMSDLTAKEGSQTTCVTVFGTFLGIALSNLIGPGHMEYVLMASMCISAISLTCITQSLKCVSLPTLNYQRGELLTSHYLKTGVVLPPESVASMERRFLPYLKVKGKDAEIPVVVGIPVKTTLSIATTKDDCDYFLKQFENKNYLLSFCSYKQGLYRSLVNHERRRKMIIGISLKDKATSEDQISAYYHAHLLRRELNNQSNSQISFQKQIELINKTMHDAEITYPQYKEELEKNGWNCVDLFFEEKSQRYCN